MLLLVVAAEFDVAEANGPDAFVDFFEAEPLAGESRADVDLSMVHRDRASGADETLEEEVRVLGLWQGLREATSGPLPARSGRDLAERFVRLLVVADLAEAIETALLHPPVARARLARLGLEFAMESLVSAALLRVGRLDP